MNTGVILEQLNDQDLVFGSNKRVVHNVSLEDRNWLPYFSAGEVQIGAYFDTMGCVSFSALNVIEALINYQIMQGAISPSNLRWLQRNGYLNEEGMMDCSDRFTVAMSKTGPNGNSGRNVWTSVRNDGVVPEKDWQWNRGRNVPEGERFGNWYRDPKNVPSSLKRKGKEFVSRFEIFFEVVPMKDVSIQKALKGSPLQVFIASSCPIKNSVHEACGNTVDHAVTMVDDTDPRKYYPLFDHYIRHPKEQGNEQFIRRVAKDFPFYSIGYTATIIERAVNPSYRWHFFKKK